MVTEEQQCEQGDSKTIGAVVGPTTNDTVLVPPELTDHDKKVCRHSAGERNVMDCLCICLRERTVFEWRVSLMAT